MSSAAGWKIAEPNYFNHSGINHLSINKKENRMTEGKLKGH